MARRRAKRTYRILPAAPTGPRSEPPLSIEEAALEVYKRPRRVLIAEAAYYRAERRGFGGGDPVQDWLAAEAEVDELLARAGGRRSSAQPLDGAPPRNERSQR